jgi:hypothetical protein
MYVLEWEFVESRDVFEPRFRGKVKPEGKLAKCVELRPSLECEGCCCQLHTLSMRYLAAGLMAARRGGLRAPQLRQVWQSVSPSTEADILVVRLMEPSLVSLLPLLLQLMLSSRSWRLLGTLVGVSSQESGVALSLTGSGVDGRSGVETWVNALGMAWPSWHRMVKLLARGGGCEC